VNFIYVFEKLKHRDKQQEFMEIGIFTSNPLLSLIVSKVSSAIDFSSISNLIHSQNKFKLDILFNDFPKYKKIIGSDGTEKRLTTSIFEQLEVFNEIGSENDGNEVRILGLKNNNRIFRFIKTKYIEDHLHLKKYKVLLPFSNGSGTFGETLSSPLVVGPFTGFTQSFISIGIFDSLIEAEACHKYIQSKFTRAMLGVLKATQHNSKDVWNFVPIQDFTSASGIDWSQSVADIDRQLYAKYELSDEEKAFIESMIKPME
jgi:hypothetical protein